MTAKLKVNEPYEAEAPSAQLVREAAQEVTVKDARGRSITMRKPTALAQFRFVEVLGKSAANEVYYAMAMPLQYITAIDGNPEPALTTKSMVEALIQRLDEDGIEAAHKAILEHFGVIPDAEEAKKK